MMKRGLISLYYGFIEHLKKETTASRVAPLQMTGRLEDYFCREFCEYVFRKTEGYRFAVSNLGNQNEQKIDIAILKHKESTIVIDALIEAKYLRNRHRFWESDATDEIHSALKKLYSQCKPVNSTTHSYYDLQLSSRNKSIYGLVFASYVSKRDNYYIEKRCFFEKCITKAKELGFRYHDLPYPILRSAFEDKVIQVLGNEWLISLRLGLWRIDEVLKKP
jgi:hypothetical protein